MSEPEACRIKQISPARLFACLTLIPGIWTEEVPSRTPTTTHDERPSNGPEQMDGRDLSPFRCLGSDGSWRR